MDNCPCGSGISYEQCCMPLIKGERHAQTPLELLRSRYSAYTRCEVDYILRTIHPDMRPQHDEATVRKWARQSEWQGLSIISATGEGPQDEEGQVEFIVEYRQKSDRTKHHEIADFKKVDGIWYFYDGTAPKPETFIRQSPKIGRNDPCPCGSGKKYKKCCG